MVMNDLSKVIYVFLLFSFSSSRILTTNPDPEVIPKSPVYKFSSAPLFNRDQNEEPDSTKDEPQGGSTVEKEEDKNKDLHEIVERQKTLMMKQFLIKFSKIGLMHSKLTEEQYFRTPAKKLTCIEHITMMEVGYSCLDTKSIPPEDRLFVIPDDIKGAAHQTIFVVTKTNRKYFMKVLDEMYDLELAIMRKYFYFNQGLELIEYKIVNSRFVGIYSYIEHSNTLNDWILNKDLTIFEQILILEKITSIASNFFQIFEPKNNLLKLNLLPSNILVTNESFFKLRLINFTRYLKTENDLVVIPESEDISTKLNQRSTIVYLLGKVFYYIIFKKYVKGISIADEPNIIEFKKNNFIKGYPDLNPKLIEMIHEMLNKSPIDRPSLEYIMEELHNFKLMQETPYYWFVQQFAEIRLMMEHEIRGEYIENEENIRKVARNNALIRKSQYSLLLNAKYKAEIRKSDHLRSQYISYIGRYEKCMLSSTTEQTNIIDSYGLIPFFDKGINDKDYFEVIHLPHAGDKRMEIELAVLIVILVIANFAVSLYFILKNMNIKIYMKKDFPAKLIHV